ncbi:MAG: ATP-dependent sacrificial sulfur transferase LarE [Planctomycetota bacterium]
MTTLAQPRPGLDARRAALRAHLAELGRLAVAFSGGVDSSALLAEAVAVLGDGALAVIADSPSLPRRELIEARRIATQLGARLVEVRTTEGNNPAYQANLGNRCYFCKFALFDAMQAVCAEHKVPWMAFGEITDDFRDHRPGAQAAREFGVVAPLSKADLDKADVRALAAAHGLEVADKPASACLASRIPVGTVVTPERLATVEAAEETLRDLGFAVLRVRHHGAKARIEVDEDQLSRAEELRGTLVERLALLGFEAVEIAVYPRR